MAAALPVAGVVDVGEQTDHGQGLQDHGFDRTGDNRRR
jgi:hypothetical protein